MSRKSKARRAQALAEASLRAANGSATLKDVDFITRMSATAKSKDPWTGASKDWRDDKSNGYPSYNGNRQSGLPFHTSTYKPTTLKTGEDGVFHCAESDELTKECPIAKVPDIYFNNRQWDVLMHCTEEYDTEWIALLLGELTEIEGKPIYQIKDFYFPPQTASGTHVDVPIEVRPKAGTIGAIHSHVNMGVFFSGTDVAHSNWPVEIVINRKRDYKAVARHKLKCGEYAKNDAKVFVTGTILPVAIKAALDLAFVQGTQIEAASLKRSNGKGKGVTTTVNIPAIPLGIAEEDKAKVSEAIIHLAKKCPNCKSGMRTAFYNDCITNPHPWHKETNSATTAATITPAAEESFINRKLTDEPCPEVNCVREKGHAGLHRDKTDSHFLSGKEQDQQDAMLSKAASADANPEGEDDLTYPFGGASSSFSLVIPEEEAADLRDEIDGLEDEDYCLECKGTGFITQTHGRHDITIAHASCLGTGLSKIGREKVREEMYDNRNSNLH